MIEYMDVCYMCAVSRSSCLIQRGLSAIIKRMAARWTHTLLVKIVLAWQADTIDEKRRRASEQRLLLRIKNRGIAQAYLQWCHHVSERRFLRATLNRYAQTNSPPAQTHVDPHPPYLSPCRCVMAVMEAELSWGFFGWQRFVEDSITAEAEAKEKQIAAEGDDGGDAEVLDVGDPAGDDDAALQNGVGHLNLAFRPTDLAKLISDAEVSCREAVADTIGHHKKKIAATEPSAKRLKGKQPTPEKRPPPPDSTFDTPAKRRASPKQTPEKGAAPATSPSTSPDKSAIEDRLWPATLQEFNNATATRVAGIQLMGKIAGIVALSKLEFSDPEISIALERDVLSVLNSDVLSGDFEHIFVKLVLKKERGKIIFQLKNTQNKAICQTIAPAAEPDAVEQAYMTAMVLSWIAAAGGGKDALRVAKALINACPAN